MPTSKDTENCWAESPLTALGPTSAFMLWLQNLLKRPAQVTCAFTLIKLLPRQIPPVKEFGGGVGNRTQTKQLRGYCFI